MKIKTSELTGVALDWAVAQADNQTQVVFRNKHLGIPGWAGGDYNGHSTWISWYPSTDWSQGGPIIERGKIAILPDDGHRFSQWRAFCWHPSQHDLTFEDATSHMEAGPTPLIAAMRCFVASKLGDEVDVPEELLK